MSINHHPSDELLLDYATGAMEESWALAIATHLALCPKCRQAIASLEALGGHLLESIEPSLMTTREFDAVMARLKIFTPELDLQTVAVANVHEYVLPQPLREYVGSDVDRLKWQRLGLGAFQFLVRTKDSVATVRLLRIPAGRAVPRHTHRGLELTLVVSGAFFDETGFYGRGDLQEADADLTHQPHAEKGEDCICLAITDAPLRFSNVAVRMVQPLLGI